MSRVIGKLTALKVARAHEPGMYADGGGLYLQVSGGGARSWVYRFMLRGKEREMGLGSFSAVSLADARATASDCRRLRQQGIDPIDTRRSKRQQDQLAAVQTTTFKQCAETYIKSHRAGWRNAKHAAQWAATLATYAEPIIGALPVQAVDTALVMKVLEQEVGDARNASAASLWTAKPETAGRLRGRIESILDWAKARNYRDGENPARWRGHLDKLLPPRSKVRKVKHHAALPYAELPGFLIELRDQEGVAGRALEFTILTAARTGETIGATWDEIDRAERMWTIPDGRMKAGKEHRVPLCDRALEILTSMKILADAGQPFVFPGGKSGKPLSNMAMTAVLRRMGRGNVTVHGFRSTFRDWAADRTNFPREVAEMALAHAVSDKVEAAYRRGDLLEKRRRLMDAWAEFCAKPAPAGTVVQLRGTS